MHGQQNMKFSIKFPPNFPGLRGHLKMTTIILALNYQKEPSRFVQQAVKLLYIQRADRPSTSVTDLKAKRAEKQNL